MSLLYSHKRMLVSASAVHMVILLLASVLWGDSMYMLVIAAIYACAILIVAIWRLHIIFALLVGVLPLEITSLVPTIYTHGLTLHPYQFLIIACSVGIIVRWRSCCRALQGVRYNWVDVLLGVFILLSYVSAYFSIDLATAFRNTIILTGFFVLYVLVRFFVRTIHDVLGILPLIIASGVVTALYAITQNVLYMHGFAHMEMMPGRPNATFSEPDWLGMYLVFVFAAIVTYLYMQARRKHLWKFFDIALFISAVIVITALIITVARSAWIGVALVTCVYFSVLLLQKTYKMFARHAMWFAAVVMCSVMCVYGGHLTNFELDNRATSTNTGKQEITVACDTYDDLLRLQQHGDINTVDELDVYQCQHINLEDVETEQNNGHAVGKIYRTDPTVAVRVRIYTQTIHAIQERPYIGYGWGTSSMILGVDENGTPLNASNMFLEIALAVGVGGVVIFGLISIATAIYALRTCMSASHAMYRIGALYVLLSGVAIIVPNLFNAGLFLGYVWVYCGILAFFVELLYSDY